MSEYKPHDTAPNYADLWAVGVDAANMLDTCANTIDGLFYACENTGGEGGYSMGEACFQTMRGLQIIMRGHARTIREITGRV